MRTDVHRSSAIVPADYSLVEYFGWMAVPGEDFDGNPITEREPYGEEAMAAYEDGPTVELWPALTQCDVCGARFVHGAVMTHTPTGLLLSIGHDCASKYLALRSLPRRERADRAARRLRRRLARRKMRVMLAANPGLNAALKTDHDISRNLRGKAIFWGDLSEKQIELAFNLVTQVAERKKAEVPGVPIPDTEKRQVYRGHVLGTKCVDGFGYGQDVIKMLVQVRVGDGAYKIWGTAPDAILGNCPLKGCEVEFTARIEVSKDDPCFGFFKNPTKVTIVKETVS